MRRLTTLLVAWLVCSGAALAQTPPLPGPAAPASPPVSMPAAAPACDWCSLLPDASDKFSAEVDLRIRWYKPVCELPPVLSIGNPAAPIPGAVGQPGTVNVIGGKKFEFPATPGGQLILDWERSDGAFGVEVSGYVMNEATGSQSFSVGPSGAPNTYLNYQATNNTQQALPFTIPGVVTGGIQTVGSSKVWGVESDLTLPYQIECAGHCFSGKFLVGGRYLDLYERVRITNSLALVGDPAANAIGADAFITHNQFFGPETGMALKWGSDWVSLEYTMKLAAGLVHQTRTIQGSPLAEATVLSPLLVPGPLQVLPSNINRETAYRVALVPDVGLKTRVHVTSWCSVTLGYSLLYLNKQLCPGDQISSSANITQLPFHGPVTGPLAPLPLFVHTDYFEQGFDAGVEITF